MSRQMVIFARESFSFLSKPTVFRRRKTGYPHARRRVLKLERDSWKFFSEEFVRRSLIASPLIKPLLTPGG